jgi:transcriptional regulator with XRE-family HTH domain
MPEQPIAAEPTIQPDDTISDANVIGRRIRGFRKDRNMSLSDLATSAGVSKSHLSVIENGTGARPGAAILHKLAVALGVTLADVLGREIRAQPPAEIPPSLLEFAKARHLPQADVDMLASIAFRGEQPRTPERWSYIYTAIRTSASLDPDD